MEKLVINNPYFLGYNINKLNKMYSSLIKYGYKREDVLKMHKGFSNILECSNEKLEKVRTSLKNLDLIKSQ